MVRGILQARMSSRKLPGKPLLPLNNKPLMLFLLERLDKFSFLDDILVATSQELTDLPVVSLAESLGYKCFKGDSDDILNRFIQSSKDLSDDDLIIRFTVDNVLYDYQKSLEVFEAHEGHDYTFIEGLSRVVPEIITLKALRYCDEHCRDPFQRQYVTQYLRKSNNHGFKTLKLPSDFNGLRPEYDKYLTVDSKDDLERIENILDFSQSSNEVIDLDRCYDWLDKDESIPKISKLKPNQLRYNLVGHKIGDGCPAFIIAEIGQNHNGDMAIARQLIELAARCGVDAVKFQKRDIDSELTKEAFDRPYVNKNSFGPTYGEHRQFLELDEDQHRELEAYANAHDLLYFCTPCDIPSVDMMERIGCPFYKVASRDLTNIPLLERLSITKKPVIISTGMADIQDIDDALEALGVGPPCTVIMQCTSSYPAAIAHVNLEAMKTMRMKYNLLVGLSDHTSGVITSVAAVVKGACMIEKHITLSKAMKGSDHAGSLEEDELRTLVKDIRTVELAMGDGVKQINPITTVAKHKLARSLTSKSFIAQGVVLTENMLTLKSPGDGLKWKEKVLILGKQSVRDIEADVTLSREDFT